MQCCCCLCAAGHGSECQPGLKLDSHCFPRLQVVASLFSKVSSDSCPHLAPAWQQHSCWVRKSLLCPEAGATSMYIYALNIHACNICTSSMHISNMWRCIKYIYLFLLMGSFSGLAKTQGAAGQWLAQGTTLMAAKCIWILSCWDRVGRGAEAPWCQESSPRFCFSPSSFFMLS